MALGERLFSFAVIADTHVNQEEGKASSDFAVNALSNARNRHVIASLNRAKPAFVLHLGDIVHPSPRHPAYATAANVFHGLASQLQCPLYLTPGNHDVGDKPGDWLPVPSVSDEYLALYRQHFGANYFSFDARGCHFVVLDAQIVNSGLAAEGAQRRWLEADLATNAGGRIFLCTHYPPYLLDAGEGGHYDNIDEPGRAWLLALLERHRVEALFAGHVHNFWYHLHGETEMYLLPSTAFVRLDYSEMFRVEPGPERGRNDAPKLGYLIVDVHECGHVAHPVRTNGECLAPGESLPDEERLPLVHARSIERSPLGLDLRHPWSEITEVAASGAIDEFARKCARNDYPVMALWEMGIRRLRVPVSDLLDPRTRERMRVLRRSNHEFTVYTHGIPGDDALALLARESHLVADWEVIAPLAGIEALAARISALRKTIKARVRLSKLRRPDDALHHGDRARHVIEHGFYPAEQDQVAELRGRSGEFRAAFDALLFRVPRAVPAWSELSRIAEIGSALGLAAHAYVRLAADNPAQAQDDDLANANRVAEMLFAAHALPQLGVWGDTLDDVDRGYFPRTGLVDRRFNPRMAGRACRHLNSALARDELRGPSLRESKLPAGRVIAAESHSGTYVLILPERTLTASSLPVGGSLPGASGRARCIDLDSGRITHMSWKQSAGAESSIELARELACAFPLLVQVTA